MKHPLDKVDQLHAELKALLPFSSEVEQKLHKKFRLEFNYNSNHLEGNTLTYSETELLLIFDDTKGNHTLREYEEMKAHDVAYQTIEDWAKDPEHELTERDIRNLNQLILVRDFWKDAITPDGQSTRRKIKVGEYKEQPNSVRLQNGEMFHYTAPGDVPAAMQELMQWYRDERAGLHPLTLAAMFHYKFVCIHPFDDGNGRLARLLMNYVLLKNGYPPIVIKSKEKADYLRALNRADAGIYDDFISYISEQEIWSLEIYVKAAKGESIEEPEDWEKELTLLKKNLGQTEHSIVELRFSKENVENVYQNSISPLINQWERALLKFDTLFYYRKSKIDIDTNSQPFSSYQIDCSELLSELENNWQRISSEEDVNIVSIKIFSSFEKLRIENGSKIDKFWAGTVEFDFHDNAYEIKLPHHNKIFSLMYGEFLSDSQSDEIVNLFSRNLMNAIKEAKDGK